MTVKDLKQILNNFYDSDELLFKVELENDDRIIHIDDIEQCGSSMLFKSEEIIENHYGIDDIEAVTVHFFNGECASFI